MPRVAKCRLNAKFQVDEYRPCWIKIYIFYARLRELSYSCMHSATSNGPNLLIFCDQYDQIEIGSERPGPGKELCMVIREKSIVFGLIFHGVFISCLYVFQIPPSMLESLLVLVEQGYCNNGNPYHNNMHACDVLQTTHYFISRTGLAVSQTILSF